MARTATGVDIGKRSAIALRGHVKGNSFVVTDFEAAQHGGGGLADGWRALPGAFKLGRTRVGLTGPDVNVRYVRVPRVPDWQLRKLMRFEVAEIGEQSESSVASDFNVLPEIPEIEGEDVVLLAMARESLLEQQLEGLSGAGGSLDAFTPNAIGLYNAWLRYGVLMEDTVLVANIGHENIDVIIARGTDLLFARNLTGGSQLFDQTISQQFGVSAERAEQIKIEMATLEPGARYRDANEEKASRALLAPAGQLSSLLQSTVAFCKSQVKLSGLRLDRVMLCGGGSALRGLDRYLGSALGVPVESFDPFRIVDTSGLDPRGTQQLEEFGLEAVVALGLATAGSDPDSYSIEILPAKLQKRRDFLGGTAFLIAAAVLALLYLGFFAMRTRTELSSARKEVAQLESQYQRTRSAHLEAVELLAENESLASLAGSLYDLAGSGEQLARVLSAVAEVLPTEFWLTGLRSDWGIDPELGIPQGDKHPIVHIEGRAREGTDSVAGHFQNFVEALRRRLPEARIKESLSPAGSRFTVDLSLLVEAAAVREGEGS